MPLDALERQRGAIPANAYVLTEQEAQREIANCILFCFMDVLSICAWGVVLFRPQGSCKKPLTAWYTLNGLWATLSILFMAFYTLR